MKTLISTIAICAAAIPAFGEEVNVYSYRQPELLAPLTEAFTDETGIKVNVAFLNKGMVERLAAEGKRSPADLVFTVDISRLSAVVDAGFGRINDARARRQAPPMAIGIAILRRNIGVQNVGFDGLGQIRIDHS